MRPGDSSVTTDVAPERILVLHVLPQDLRRGAQVYAGKLRDALRGDETQEHIVVTLFQGPVGGAQPDIALKVPSGIGRKLVDLRAVLRLRRLIRRRKASVIVAHGGEALKYVIPAASNRPTVYYKVGLSTAEVQRPVHRRLYRFLSRRAVLVVGNSSAILHQVGVIFRVPWSRLLLIPNARDPEVYRPLIDSERPAKPPRVLFIGQLEPGKRPDLFLDAIEELRKRDRPFEALMVGDGPLRTLVEPRAEALGVQLLGVRSDVPQLIREAGVVVMTSEPTTEGMPGVLIEAGLSGVPTVATVASGVEDVVLDGKTGWIVRDARPEAIAQRIGGLLDDPDLATAQGAEARMWCRQEFSVGAVAARWRNVVADLTTPPRDGKHIRKLESSN